MSLSYPHFGVPELKSLPVSERSRVWRECVHPLVLKGKFPIYSLLLSLAMVNVVFLLNHESIGSGWRSALFFGLLMGASSLITSWIAAWKFRPQIRRYMAEHQIEGKT